MAATEHLPRPLGKVLHRVAVSDVHRHCQRLAALGPQCIRRAIGGLELNVGGDHMHAAARTGMRQCRADTAASTGDHGDLSCFQFHCSDSLRSMWLSVL